MSFNLASRFMLPVCFSSILMACTSESMFNTDDRAEGNTKIIATTDNSSQGSRTMVDPYNYPSGEIGILWLPGDQIGVFGSGGSSNVAFSNVTATALGEATFTGNLASGERPAMAYYPYNPNGGNDRHNVAGTLPLIQNFSITSGELQGDYKYGLPVAGGTDGQFTFRHLFAFLKFTINAAGSAIANDRLESISLEVDDSNVQLGGDFTFDCATGDNVIFTPTDGSNKLTMNWTDTPLLKNGVYTGYMTCAPVDLSGKKFVITVKTSTSIVTFPIDANVGSIERNCYYNVPLTMNLIEKLPDYENKVRDDLPDAAWVPGLQSRLACANTVFSLPSTPFMHKIRVSDKNAVISAYNLPEGLTWNSKRNLVEGQVAVAGDYTYSVLVRLSSGEVFTEGIRLTVSPDLHQPTPHMGWQSWNVLETKVDENSIMEIADALVDNGFKEVGYVWLGIDDCWQKQDGSRDSNGVPVVNPTKFPNGLKYVTDYIHSKGMKAGIYSDAGTLTCASGSQGGGTLLGAYNYESQIAKAFTDWGFDKLKEDWFWSGHGDNNGALDPSSTSLAFELYSRMGNAIKGAGNKILLSMCEWGLHEPWKWGAEAGASSWRVTYDARDGWMGKLNNGSANSNSENTGGIGLKNTIDLMRNLWPYAGVNRFNDADMLCVGIRGTGTSSNDLVYGNTFSKGMDDEEYETCFVMWCMWSSPLLLTLDVRKTDINAHDLALLKNTELIAINQDPMGQAAESIKTDGNLDYYCKDLANGDVAVAVVNLGNSSAEYSINLEDYDALESTMTYNVRDLLAKSDAGQFSVSSPISGTLKSHAVRVVRLTRR